MTALGFCELSPQPQQRDSGLAIGDVAPGIFPGETAVQLDDGSLVAVAVDTSWLANGGGVAIRATARCIAADGSSLACPHGQQLVTAHTYSADAGLVALYGAPALAREVLLLVLGEAPTIVEKGPPGDVHAEPMIAWGDDVRLNASIRHALACAAAVPAASDSSALLFQSN